ncbi:hypothetical protein ACLBOM_10170 [Escherichia coli]
MMSTSCWRRLVAGISVSNQMVNFLQSQFNKPSAEEQDAAALKQLQQKLHAAKPQ